MMILSYSRSFGRLLDNNICLISIFPVRLYLDKQFGSSFQCLCKTWRRADSWTLVPCIKYNKTLSCGFLKAWVGNRSKKHEQILFTFYFSFQIHLKLLTKSRCRESQMYVSVIVKLLAFSKKKNLAPTNITLSFNIRSSSFEHKRLGTKLADKHILEFPGKLRKIIGFQDE